MPGWSYGSECDDRRKWPVKVMVGTFSSTKQLMLESRYARRRIRLEFRRA